MNQDLVSMASGAIEVFDPFSKQLADFHAKYDGVVYDLDDEEQNKAARSDRLAIGKVIAKLDRTHKEIKAPLAEAVSLIDSTRKQIKDDLLGIQGAIKTQIAAHEQKEKERVDALVERVAEIRALAEFEFAPTTEVCKEWIEAAKGVPLDDSWQEFKAEAALAKTETIAALETLLAARQKAEAEAAELERLRAEAEARERADREERIRKEAEEKAKREAAEAAEQAIAEERRKAEEAKEAAERAEREAAERAEKAREDERQRIERERKEAEAKAKKEAEADERRQANKRHRAKVEREAAADMVSAGITDAVLANALVAAIRDEKIAHIEINYY